MLDLCHLGYCFRFVVVVVVVVGWMVGRMVWNFLCSILGGCSCLDPLCSIGGCCCCCCCVGEVRSLKLCRVSQIFIELVICGRSFWMLLGETR